VASAHDLLAALVACDSTNPQLVPGGAGEAGVAGLLAGWLAGWGFEVELTEPLPGRPNVIGRLRGSGGGKSLMLCGHTDVVGADPAGFVPEVRDGIMRGRGVADMKGGIAAALVAASRIAAESRPLAGDLLVAGCIDEEWASEGAVALAASHPVDAVILPEQTNLELVTEHGGFGWFEIESRGVEAAGIEPDRGVDAIALLAPVLAEIDALDAELAARPRAAYGRASVHASTIAGGTQFPAYPKVVTLGVERCTLADERWRDGEAELEAILARARAADPRFAADLRTVIGREGVRLAEDEPIVRELAAAAQARLGREAVRRGDMGWMDSGVFAEAGIPCIIFGPTGGHEHSPEEWVDLDSVEACADILEATARAFCASA
jgi:acetylornithine deacetylase